MRLALIYIGLLVIVFPGLQCKPDINGNELSVLVISGDHNYDTAEFEQMFNDMESINPEFAVKPGAMGMLGEKSTFDVLVFYDMYQEISEEHKTAFLEEFDKGTGMVFLHHSLGSYQEWPEYAKLVGGKFYMKNYTADTSLVLRYYHDLNLDVIVLDKTHPVTRDVEDFKVIDEGYTRTELIPGLNYLLETDHPGCDRYIGWEHSVRNSRVVYLMGGHDRKAYQNESFSRIVENAILWTSQSGN
jgi:type 1 glutamine amidotransferase